MKNKLNILKDKFQKTKSINKEIYNKLQILQNKEYTKKVNEIEDKQRAQSGEEEGDNYQIQKNKQPKEGGEQIGRAHV